MKERPILFSAPMVRAILAGTKNQTRRVVKPQWQRFENACPMPASVETDRGVEMDFPGRTPASFLFHNGIPIRDGEWQPVPCPYGQPGDRLWVREAWRVAECYDERRGSDLRFTLSARNVQYAAGEQFLGAVQGRYRHARFMPRWASRITLEICSVRVERLKDISEADALAEGTLNWVDFDSEAARKSWEGNGAYAKGQYRNLWQSINGPGSWDANPWTWVVEFRRVEQ